MPTFENPSHRRRLTELGILSPDESYVAPADLAHRMVASPYFEEGLYIIKQDFAHPVTTLGMIESQLEMLEHEAHQIQSTADLYQVAAALQGFFQLPERIGQLVKEMIVLGEALNNLLGENITSVTKKHLDDIDRFRQELISLLTRQEKMMLMSLAEISAIVERKV